MTIKAKHKVIFFYSHKSRLRGGAKKSGLASEANLSSKLKEKTKTQAQNLNFLKVFFYILHVGTAVLSIGHKSYGYNMFFKILA